MALATIVVVGSANQDYIVRVEVPPGPGETVLGRSLLKQPGGKGANQAVAAARLRGNVSFVAAVGDDADGAFLLRELRSEGVDTTNVEIINRGRTGLALVSVYDSGENSITVIPGSNFALTRDRVERTVARLAQDYNLAVVVVQAELLTEIIEAAILSGEKAGARSILNLAPYQPIRNEILALCDPLVVNETEASALVGWQVRDAPSAARAAEQLRGVVRSVVITIGAEGAYWQDAESSGHVSAPTVYEVVDTTGAGDAFVGALASFLARGESLGRAVEVGVLAGSFAVTSPGAQSSYPTLVDLQLDTLPLTN
ncbi:ribokinase [Glaciihabitans sp. UYNi722]|uniref:ribokinase n=1 Tax=Glaciihabitans sp. UYNi722 TaxID=3156344 RepID=UPI003394E22B